MYPYYLREVEDIKAIASIEKTQLLNLKTAKEYVLSNVTLKYLYVDGIAKWETILGGYDTGTAAPYDVYQVRNKLGQAKIVTVNSICEYLKSRYGEGKYSVEYDADNFVLNVKVQAIDAHTRDLYERLREYVPCNIEVYVERIEA